MYFCCFPSPTPTLPPIPTLQGLDTLVNDNKDSWSETTTKNNIQAVPYSESVEDLNKIKKIVEQYRSVISTSNFSTEKKLRVLEQLENLYVVTNKRLAEVPYLKVTETLETFAVSMQSNSKMAIHAQVYCRTKMDEYHKQTIELTELIRNHSENILHYQKLEKLLLEFILQAVDLQRYLLQVNNKKLVGNTEKTETHNALPPLWSFKEIKQHCENAPSMDLMQLADVTAQARTQLTCVQKELLSEIEKLNFLKYSQDLLEQNSLILAKFSYGGNKTLALLTNSTNSQ